MSKKITPINTDEWLSAVFTHNQPKPEGSVTVDEVAEKTGLSRSRALGKLNELVKKGKAKKGTFTSNGTTKNYYIPIQ